MSKLVWTEREHSQAISGLWLESQDIFGSIFTIHTFDDGRVVWHFGTGKSHNARNLAIAKVDAQVHLDKMTKEFLKWL